MEPTIDKITVGEWDENTYLIYGQNDLVIVDPGDEPERLIAAIEATGAKPAAILITHGHFDHIGAVCPLMKHFNIPFYIHSKDKRLLRQANFYRKMSHSETFIEIPKADRFLDDNKTLTFGEISLEVLHVPGHTNGSVCFKTGNHLISGDLIFEYDEGRTDLPESNGEELKTSIQMLVEKYADGLIYPGHGNNFAVKDIDLKTVS